MMVRSTGEQRAMPCATCGALLIHTGIAQIGGDASGWDAPRHDAPCGAPCLGGGIVPAVARSHRYHGGRGACPCRQCGEEGRDA